ncbi:recombinase family protein [Sebaldella sp. S0638]|nr:recombinase family protein [Sebaldella sp. S0638]
MQEEGRSLEYQIKKCQDFCELKGYSVYKTFQDVESGGKDERVGFIDLQKEIEIKNFDILVVFESSRISRVTRTMLDFVFKLQTNDIKFVSISQPELDTTTHTGMLFFQIQASLGEYERKLTSSRVKTSKWQRVKEGNWQGGKMPLGYENTKDGIVIVEDESQIVRNIFEYYIATKSLGKTSKLFKKHISSIKWILSNEFYTGMFPFGRKENNINTGKVKIHDTPIEIFEGKHEAIIDKNTFNIVQEFLKIGRPCTLKGYILIFSGLIVCEHGKKMYKNSKNKKGNYFYYYRAHKCSCSLPSEDIEAKVIQELLKMEKLRDLRKNEVEIQKILFHINLLTDKLKEIDNRRKKYIDLYTNDIISNQELDSYIQKINKEKMDINNDIELQEKLLIELDTEGESEVLNTLEDVLANMEDMDRKEIQELFRLLIKKIELTSINPISLNVVLNI